MSCVDNFEKISELLDDEHGYFYFLQLIQRGKDGFPGGGNNNARQIRCYYINSAVDLMEKRELITNICGFFGARAMLDLNRRSYEKVAFEHLRLCAKQIADRQYSNCRRAWNSCCGSTGSDRRRWIVDIDEEHMKEQYLIINTVNNARPLGDKIITTLRSRTGCHLITSPFDLQAFSKALPDIDVHKNNPTNLYIPYE
jgi:hypothetical protein